jgi:hypothetical protein
LDRLLGEGVWGSAVVVLRAAQADGYAERISILEGLHPAEAGTRATERFQTDPGVQL